MSARAEAVRVFLLLGIMQLIPNPPGEIVGGEILYKGQDLVKKSEKDMQKIRGNEISMIFQDSGAMMNPTRKVGDVFVEYLRTHEKISKKDAWKKRLWDAGKNESSKPG